MHLFTRISQKTKISLLYILLILILICILPGVPASIQQDGFYKYIQMVDFIEQDFQSLERYYIDPELKPNKKEVPFEEPFTYQIKGSEYFVFPFFWIILNTPFILLLGFYGIYILSTIFGMLSIFLLRDVLMTLEEPEQKIIDLSLLFYAISTPLLIYTSWFYEANFCNFLFFLFLILMNSHIIKIKLFLYSTIVLSFIFLLRIEVFYLSMIYLSVFTFYNFLKDQQRIFVLGLSVILTLLINTVIHMVLYNFPFPIRMMQTDTTITMMDRLFRIVEYLFFSKHSLLLYFSLSFITLCLFWKSINQKMKVLLTSTWIFILTLPFLAPHQQGSDIFPRYFYPIMPFLGFFALHYFYNFTRFKGLWTRIIVFIQPTVIIFLALVISIGASYTIFNYHNHFKEYFTNYNIIHHTMIKFIAIDYKDRMIYSISNIEDARELDSRIYKLRGVRPTHFFLKHEEFDLEQVLENFEIVNEYKNILVGKIKPRL